MSCFVRTIRSFRGIATASKTSSRFVLRCRAEALSSSKTGPNVENKFTVPAVSNLLSADTDLTNPWQPVYTKEGTL